MTVEHARGLGVPGAAPPPLAVLASGALGARDPWQVTLAGPRTASALAGYTAGVMPSALPSWLETVRRTVVIDRVRADKRSERGLLLGVEPDRIPAEVLGQGARCGQTDFTKAWNALSPDDVVLLYGWFNQRGHLEELVEAFGQLFARSSIREPIVIDLGCGPCTGGLALAAALDADHAFTYIGVDPATAMHRLGERLAQAAMARGRMTRASRYWLESIAELRWTEPTCWRPVIIIVSYLLASPSLDTASLLEDTLTAVERMSWGSVTVVYTNAIDNDANLQFPTFQEALDRHGFELIVEDEGSITIERQGRLRNRRLRYALFHRQQRTLFQPSGGD